MNQDQQEAFLSIFKLIRLFIEQVFLLIRQQLLLGKEELKTETKTLLKGLGFMIVGMGLLMTGLLYTSYGIIHLINSFVENLWVATFIFSSLFLLGAVILLVLGYRYFGKVNYSLPKTSKAFRENMEWVKEQLN